MIKNVSKVSSRLLPVIVLALSTACGNSEDASGDAINTTPDTPVISNDETTESITGGERSLLVSDTTSSTKTITQCVCSLRFRSTLQIYHFEDQNAVLLIEFDNQTSDFNRTASVALFDAAQTADDVSNWINNQYSDGLFNDNVEPLATYPVAANAITITSTAFVDTLTGPSQDEYEQTRIEFTVDNLSVPNSYYLNGFADQTVVYLQTQ